MLYDMFRVIGDTGLVDHLGFVEADSADEALAVAKRTCSCSAGEHIEVEICEEDEP